VVVRATVGGEVGNAEGVAGMVVVAVGTEA
jgi:hypothetical protein